MPTSSIHGFPRLGPRRELKFAVEGLWSGKHSAEDVRSAARELRRQAWELMRDAGIDLVPSNDFSLYDHVLDTTALVGAVPERYGHPPGGDVDLDTYFAMARGRQTAGHDETAMEMTKWFDTNYHYLVPELGPETSFRLSTTKPFDEFDEAKALGIVTKPVLLGPVTFLLLGKSADGVPDDFDRLSLLEPLLEVYAQALERLGDQGAEWVQLDEPAFALDQGGAEIAALEHALDRLASVERRPKIVVSTYFDHPGEAVPVLARSRVEGVGLDFVRGPRNVELVREAGGLGDKVLFAGVVDGRNVWINDLERSLTLLRELRGLAAELVVSTSCSLLHVPLDLEAEPALDEDLRSWMAFARQKVDEVAALTRALAEGDEAIADRLEHNRRALDERLRSPRTQNPQVRARVAALRPEDERRASPFPERREAQRARLDLPLFPTTTIGSFPQTGEIRAARSALRSGEIDEAEYERRMREEIERVVRLQEELGLDVLVHGEPERNDMVQYFGERMEGFAFTQNGWVQSYGSRNVRPPIIYGDVARPHPMTVEWTEYAQSLTDKPVKGMLTGPVTMLKWSFVRDDQPNSETCIQIALAIRDEVLDLEAAGVAMIQVDEPAIREGLPLRREAWEEYLTWAVRAFRIATCGVRDETQIHTHMCYSEFGDILGWIMELDADVASVEAARSRMELMDDLRREGYTQEVGPGVYDIHSPRVPPAEEIVGQLRRAAEVLDPEQLWVNPDCGLKTRGYEETVPSLRNMVHAARQLREELAPAHR
ncbi:MAG: 5-methyltetrahydropteroyltriglutamate--homocysteine S-methyltransferase [Actinomycetota bacterium]|nr:5-methyltetrahydropteroyltriglutamate--homocysteine S-methyltransferase [Actinomycetota bacterium]